MIDKVWNNIPSDEIIAKTVEALVENGIEVVVVNTKEEAKEKLLSLIPKGSEVMDMTSVTLTTLGVIEEINNRDKYKPVKKALTEMNRETDNLKMQQIGAAPEVAIGSVHAVTEDGKVVIASNTGSQLPAYAYGSSHVFWVVGAQKITKNLDEAMKRIYDYVLPLEAERAKIAYGVSGSNVSKLLIINKEVNKDRLKMIIVKESLGF